MILACQNIEKSFGGVTLIQNASFHIEDHEKAAMVGINGAGKTTLLRIIMQELPTDKGEVILAKGKRIGYLAQHQDLDTDLTIYDSLLQVKQHILDMELQMREIEKQMKYAKADELELAGEDPVDALANAKLFYPVETLLMEVCDNFLGAVNAALNASGCSMFSMCPQSSNTFSFPFGRYFRISG